MKKHDYKKPTKKQLERISKLNRQILDYLPANDSMQGTYGQMQQYVDERIRLYEQFKVNPYKMVTTQLKYNTEGTLDMSEYMNANVAPNKDE
jgi:hypothetical protein